MITLAEQHYPEGKQFTHPWNFWVIDDFFTSSIYNQLVVLSKREDKYVIVDSSDGKNIVKNDNPQVVARKYCIRIYKSDLYQQIQHHTKKKLVGIIENNDLQELFAVCDLVKCEPLYMYPKHVDHVDKIYSIVIFLNPQSGNGTTLLDNKKKKYDVCWKQNRAFIFKSDKTTLHYYLNNTDQPRYTLNIYLSKGMYKFIVSK